MLLETLENMLRTRFLSSLMMQGRGSNILVTNSVVKPMLRWLYLGSTCSEPDGNMVWNNGQRRKK
ncbi:hypothetical protein FKP32DRAFT_1325234 [Trametes sanguinea]|nr:hypothetical protein FKP32DRAFT_1325234 [Trametes sanguinea]